MMSITSPLYHALDARASLSPNVVSTAIRRISLACCARAGRGQAIAAPPRAMKSRRLMGQFLRQEGMLSNFPVNVGGRSGVATRPHTAVKAICHGAKARVCIGLHPALPRPGSAP